MAPSHCKRLGGLSRSPVANPPPKSALAVSCPRFYPHFSSVLSCCVSAAPGAFRGKSASEQGSNPCSGSESCHVLHQGAGGWAEVGGAGVGSCLVHRGPHLVRKVLLVEVGCADLGKPAFPGQFQSSIWAELVNKGKIKIFLKF